ncbi:MAG: hypothetical protein ACYC6A_00820 [Armatimonadota bacterium]
MPTYTYSQRVQVLDTDGASIALLGAYGTNPGELQSPVDAAADGSNNTYILDAAGVSVFNADGTYTHRWAVANGLSLAIVGTSVAVLVSNAADPMTSGSRIHFYSLAGVYQSTLMLAASPLNTNTGDDVGWQYLRAGAGNTIWLDALSRFGTPASAAGLTLKNISIAGAQLSITTYTTTQLVSWLGSWMSNGSYYYPGIGLAIDESGVPWVLTSTGLRPVLLNNAGAYYLATADSPSGTGLAYQDGRFYYTRLPSSNGDSVTGDLLVKVDRAAFSGHSMGDPVDTFGPRGYNPGEFANLVTPGPGVLCRPVGIVNARLLVIDYTYLLVAVVSPLQLSSVIDRKFGLQHVAFEVASNIYHASRSLTSNTFSAGTLIAAGTLPAIELLQDGTLVVAYQTASGQPVLTQTSPDRGATWS